MTTLAISFDDDITLDSQALQAGTLEREWGSQSQRRDPGWPEPWYVSDSHSGDRPRGQRSAVDHTHPQSTTSAASTVPFKWVRLHEAFHEKSRDLPHTFHAAPFSRYYLQVRPWKPSPNDLRDGKVPSQR